MASHLSKRDEQEEADGKPVNRLLHEGPNDAALKEDEKEVLAHVAPREM